MSAAGDLGTHKGCFCMEGRRVDCLERIPSLIIVTVSAGIVKACLAHPVFLHGMDHLELVVLCCPVKFAKTLFQTLFRLLSELIHFP